MRKIACVILFLCALKPVSTFAACTIDNTMFTITCDVDVKFGTPADIMLRVWNEGTGGAKQRFVAADNVEAHYQVTHVNSWTAEIAAKNNTSD
ncbi:MAG TPA: hypothetical protein VM733_05185, partial [Thermoanaerobaculia bacterium]|nr:hypothetical protein [Thermoanaerobaculia bacterium]